MHRLAPPDTPQHELRLRIRWALLLAAVSAALSGVPCCAALCLPRAAQHVLVLSATLSPLQLWYPPCRDEVVTIDTGESIPDWEDVVVARKSGHPSLRYGPEPALLAGCCSGCNCAVGLVEV